jgi:beta-glucanase (GH16 family)
MLRSHWFLMNLIGAIVVFVVLALVLTGRAGSGQGRPTPSSLKADPVAHGSCTQFQAMVGECASATTTTTTGSSGPPDPTGDGGSGGDWHVGSGSGSTTSASGDVVPSSPTVAGTPSGSAPGAPSTAPASSADSSVSCAGTPPVPAPSGSWRCTLDDEFNGTSLNTGIWSVMTTEGSAYTTGPAGHRVCYVNSPQTVSESGGYLNLSVVEEPQSDHCTATMAMTDFDTNYLGGGVISQQKFSQEYGYFQVRSSLPPTDVPGLQETLWLFPENESLYGPWPDSGEIDFAEFYSEYPNNDIPAIHYPGATNDPNATSDTCTIPGQSTAGQFHTYALLWTPTTMTTYYDGQACMTDVYAPYVTNPDTAPEPFNQPFFLNFTAALGVGAGNSANDATPVPATTEIDWVRVWQYG